MSAKATMQTLPCRHRVVCRKCFIRTIQSAIADHSLPLKCIVCRASVLKLGQCKLDQSASTHHQHSSSPVTASGSSRRPAGSVASRTTQSKAASTASRGLPTAGPGTTEHHTPAPRASDAAQPPEVSSTATRHRESSSQRASGHRGCCHHHHIPLRQLQAGGQQQDVAAASRINKLQPLPIYPAQGSALRSPNSSFCPSTLPRAVPRPNGGLSRRTAQRLPWKRLRRRRIPRTAPRHQRSDLHTSDTEPSRRRRLPVSGRGFV